ncbi:5-formyltetrahydrofolate cyclo-ligase [Corynebacterium lubricantis]|uniref:5-formyltetrahydrofolate cyclo-ligase n=1 Tax=Corynebacterium lubricantis TaxID=541095 RepID=UPI00037F6810|nr:5-formyltetrahydrofolate cyclo-ligase [Corynebacterium lubricantis]
MNTSEEKKSALREKIVKQRRQLVSTPEVKKRVDAAIVSFAATYVRGLSNPQPRVAAYSPLPNEPGSLLLLEALASQAAEIYLPITESDGSLKWSSYRGRTDLAAGTLGIWQPTGPRYNSNLLRSCDAIFVPATAIDQKGNRLGKGAGYYDRALTNIRGVVPLVGMVYHNEFVPEVPADDLDVPVDVVITNQGVTTIAKG